MSLTHRKPRPLKRDEGTLRDDRLFIVACDDTYAPKQYFDFFQIPRVQVHVVPSEAGKNAAAHVLKRLLQFISWQRSRLHTHHFGHRPSRYPPQSHAIPACTLIR